LGHPVQRDGGGPLYLVDLASGVETVLSRSPALFHRPVLAPSGKQLVAAAVAPNLDLWVFDLP
jgi:Tol biopolymer transport system component